MTQQAGEVDAVAARAAHGQPWPAHDTLTLASLGTAETFIDVTSVDLPDEARLNVQVIAGLGLSECPRTVYRHFTLARLPALSEPVRVTDLVPDEEAFAAADTALPFAPKLGVGAVPSRSAPLSGCPRSRPG
jgi:hypothetical protein